MLYADIGDHSAAANVEKTVAIGKKTIDKTHYWPIGHAGNSKIILSCDTSVCYLEWATETVAKGTSLKNLSGWVTPCKSKAHKGL